jgi:hypothetical protein
MAVTISGTNGIAVPLGSAAAPAETNTTSSTTGIYYPTSTTLGLSTNGTNAVYIDASQNVGIGTSSPSTKFTVQTSALVDAIRWTDNVNSTGILSTASGLSTIWSTTGLGFGTGVTYNERMRIDSSGNLLVGYTSSNGSYKLQVNSQIFATSSTIATSDANYKINIMPLSGALDIVQKLNPVSFSWKEHAVHNFDTATPTVGFLAQEVQTALSSQTYVNSIVKESEVTLPDETKEKFLGIAEGNMIALLTKAIQELSAEVEALKAKVGA